MRFGKNEKLSPLYVGQTETSENVGVVAYQLGS